MPPRCGGNGSRSVSWKTMTAVTLPAAVPQNVNRIHKALENVVPNTVMRRLSGVVMRCAAIAVCEYGQFVENAVVWRRAECVKDTRCQVSKLVSGPRDVSTPV
jgi:hypothetical protein